MFRRYLLRLKVNHLRAMREQKGQSIIIFTFAFIGLIAMLGLALDLGLVYIEKIKVSRTADAAALAAVVELPFEEEGMRRAIEYIRLNGYDVGQNTEILVRGCIDTSGSGDLANVDAAGVLADTATVPITPTALMTGYLYMPAVESPPRATFVIDTLAHQPVEFNTDGSVKTQNEENCAGGTTPLYGTANKLRVSGKVNVDMNFMQFFGFRIVPVEDRAIGENVTNLDVAVVFDISGSMDFESNCFGCWVKNSGLSADIMNNPYPTNGTYRPLTSTILSGNLCTANPTPVTSGSAKALVHEAELYSRMGPVPSPWDFENHLLGSSRWVLQRVAGTGAAEDAYIRAHPFTTYSQSDINNAPAIQGMSYNSECFSVGQCWKTRGTAIGEVAPNEVPYVEYDFTPNWSGTTYIWARVQGGYSQNGYAVEWNGIAPQSNPSSYRFLTQYEKAIFWQVGTQTVQGGSYSNIVAGNRGTQDSGPLDNSEWRWLKLGSATTSQNVQTTLRLYQGSSGFSVDKIIFTNDSTGSNGVAVENNGTGLSSGDLRTLLTQNSGKGPAATAGSATREACNYCNPEFGLTIGPAQCSCKKNPTDTAVTGLYQAGGSGLGCYRVLTTTNNLSNDLFADQAPIRNAQEAVKNFAKRLDPKFDQLGFVVFDTYVRSDSANRAKLQCLRWAGQNDTDGVAGCYDPGTDPISYTKVFQGVENQNNNGGTNIAEGMREGLEELGISLEPYNSDTITHECSDGSDDGKACDRLGAARRILILMTDGSPNSTSASMCGSDVKWRGKEGANTAPYNCAIWFAQRAANANVVVYTIGIGSGANQSLLTAMAEGVDPDPASGDNGFYFDKRGGKYYPAVKPSDLDQIFTDILGNVFIRIIG